MAFKHWNVENYKYKIGNSLKKTQELALNSNTTNLNCLHNMWCHDCSIAHQQLTQVEHVAYSEHREQVWAVGTGQTSQEWGNF